MRAAAGPKRERSLGVAAGGDGEDGAPQIGEQTQLGHFLAPHALELGAVLATARSHGDRLDIARARQAVLQRQPGAHEAWIDLVAKLSAAAPPPVRLL